MPEIENYRGYLIFTAISATTSSMSPTSDAYRVRRPDSSQLAGGPFHTLEDAHTAIDADLAEDDEPRQRFILEKRSDTEQDVLDTMPRRKIGSIKFNGAGQPHSAFDADGNHLGDHDGGNAAKDAVIAAYGGR